MAGTPFSALVKQLYAELEVNPYVDTHEYPISIEEGEGRITLTGSVQDIAAKRSAVNNARKVCGDRCLVVDRVRIVPGEDKDDRDLRDEIIDALVKESAFNDATLGTRVHGKVEIVHDAGEDAPVIEVAINHGMVTLTGRVASLTHRRLTEVLVWWTAGCQLLDNRLKVDPPEADNDDELVDAVRIVLEKDPLVHAEQLRVGAAGGVVDLTGFMASDEERRLAVRDAWYVPGVWEVLDHIETRA